MQQSYVETAVAKTRRVSIGLHLQPMPFCCGEWAKRKRTILMEGKGLATACVGLARSQYHLLQVEKSREWLVFCWEQ